ncbi:MAG: pseudouridine synthase [Candidatus Mycalebacterium zealandia]|nr:MAG: pseudouridine synthase [Candidatus Mycalebacterium zealandia]
MAERVQKLLAAAGAGSRRRVEELIKSGAVAVNGSVCKLGDKAEPQDKITVDGKRIDCNTDDSPGRIIAYNKPVGKIVSMKDPQNRPTVFEDLPPLEKSRWVSVGRLDINTTGLLLFCSDGSLAHKLTHPSSGVEREYMARVRGNTGRETIEKLLSGVLLDGKKGHFEKVSPIPSKEKSNKWFKIVVKEGRNRFVRGMWESCGCSVSRLMRIRFGTVKLPKNLPVGASIFLSEKQIRKLREIAG